VIFVTPGEAMTEHSKKPRGAVNKIFGEEIPQASTDERDDGADDREADRDEWLRDNVPPHHH
jgi:hypothetical protein